MNLDLARSSIRSRPPNRCRKTLPWSDHSFALVQEGDDHFFGRASPLPSLCSPLFQFSFVRSCTRQGKFAMGKKTTQGNLFLAVVPRDSKGPQSKRPGCPVIQ